MVHTCSTAHTAPDVQSPNYGTVIDSPVTCGTYSERVTTSRQLACSSYIAGCMDTLSPARFSKQRVMESMHSQE